MLLARCIGWNAKNQFVNCLVSVMKFILRKLFMLRELGVISFAFDKSYNFSPLKLGKQGKPQVRKEQYDYMLFGKISPSFYHVALNFWSWCCFLFRLAKQEWQCTWLIGHPLIWSFFHSPLSFVNFQTWLIGLCLCGKDNVIVMFLSIFTTSLLLYCIHIPLLGNQFICFSAN